MALKALPQIQKHSDKTGGAAAHTDPPPTHPHRPGGSSVLTGGGSPAQTASSPTITRRRHRTTTWVLPSESPQPQPQPQPLSPCAQPHMLVMRSRTAWCCPRGGGCATAHPCAVSTQPWELCSEQGHPLGDVAQRSARDAPSALTVAQRPPPTPTPCPNLSVPSAAPITWTPPPYFCWLQRAKRWVPTALGADDPSHGQS